MGIFLIWNIVWAINFYSYYKFTSGYKKSPVSYFKSGRDYPYTVGYPAYLSLTGNFALTNNDNLCILIWPGLFMRGDSKYGLDISNEKSDAGYRFYVDKELKYLDVEDNQYSESEQKTIQTLLKKYHKDLEKMRKLVGDEWKQ